MIPVLSALVHVFLRRPCLPHRLPGEPGVLPRRPHSWNRFQAPVILLGLSALGLEASALQPLEAVSVQAWRQGSAVHIKTEAVVKASLDVIWNTLTDYDHLAEFIPSMMSSRVLEKRGNILTVEQSGKVRLWLFSYAINVVVEVTEQKPHAISVKVISGNLKQLEGAYQLERLGNGSTDYLLSWTGVIEPALPMPTAMALPIMRNNVTQQFEGMVREIERRQARLVQPIQQ